MQQGKNEDDVPLLIPGVRAGSQVLHPVHGHVEMQPGGEGRKVDALVRVPVVWQGEPARAQVQAEVPIPEVRRSSRVR